MPRKPRAESQRFCFGHKPGARQPASLDQLVAAAIKCFEPADIIGHRPPADVSKLLAERPKDQPWRKRFQDPPPPEQEEDP